MLRLHPLLLIQRKVRSSVEEDTERSTPQIGAVGSLPT
jgi:hypothetical protein